MNNLENFDEFYANEIFNDLPIKIKENMLIYPVKVKDIFNFNLFAQVLRFEKNYYPDVKIISMSYLEFIEYIILNPDSYFSEDESVWCLYLLHGLINLVTENPDSSFAFGKDAKNHTTIIINGVLLNRKDFDFFKLAILKQNIYGYKEEFMNPDIKKELELANKLRNKGKKMVDIEHQLIAVSIGSGSSIEEIKKMSIRKFYIMLNLINSKLEYKILKTASLSGMVKFEKEINHYLVEEDSEVHVINAEDFINKIKNS